MVTVEETIGNNTWLIRASYMNSSVYNKDLLTPVE